jgi:NAD(P)-dependent dehydrogenase (short-subunit alcohol dehydrogenase family)
VSVERTAIVTGATSGIGLACAERFAAAGWRIVLVARDGERLAATAQRLNAVPVAGDVAVPRTSHHAVTAALDSFGRLDAAIANAGVTAARTIDQTTERDLERLIGVNVKALIYLAQAAHEPLARSAGAFVVMASNKGLVAQRGSPLYVATKGAAVQLARALALDWAAEGVRVNAICPGLVDTPMLDSFIRSQPAPATERARLIAEQPLGRLAHADECAEVAFFLASPAASFVSGVALPVDGGFTAQ